MVAKNSKSWIVLSGQYGCFHGIQNSQTTGIVPRAVCSLHRASHWLSFDLLYNPLWETGSFTSQHSWEKVCQNPRQKCPDFDLQPPLRPHQHLFEAGQENHGSPNLKRVVDNCISSFCWNRIPCFLLSQSTNNKAKIRKVMMMLMSIVLFRWLL